MRSFTIAIAALALASCNRGEPRISVTDGWAREVAPGQAAAAAYLKIANDGDRADRLVGVSSPGATEAELHSSSNEGGVMRMREIENGLAIEPGSTAAFAPGGNHIMLKGLKQPLKAGQTIQLTLDFERSPDQSVAIKILPATATASHDGMAM